MAVATTVQPTGVQRTFGRDEVIVTKTDPRGRLTYANDVFCRVSAYPEEYLLGKPHNVIRHPDMPGGVFKLMWDTLTAGRELFAYAVNLAGDGAHYWVLAHVTPSHDAAGHLVGYHSNRRLPAPRALEEVRPVYQLMREAERRHGHGPEAAAAGLAVLEGLLAEQQTTYDEWVWSITNRNAQ
jgi:PAS domain S-box-containing protein